MLTEKIKFVIAMHLHLKHTELNVLSADIKPKDFFSYLLGLTRSKWNKFPKVARFDELILMKVLMDHSRGSIE